MSQTIYNSSPPIYRGDATVRLADWVIRAGAIYSMATDRKVYRAIAIRDEWIVAVSEDPHGLDALIWGGTRVIDDADLTLVPAFYDTHQHLIIHAEDMLNVMVDHVTNLSQFLDLIAQRAAQTPAGQWIKTSIGWRESNLAEGRLPNAPELDSVAPNHPVLVKRGGHVAVANSLAMAMAGITRDTPDPQGGIIQRFPDGTPNGILIERSAFEPVEKLLPPLTVEQKVEGLRFGHQIEGGQVGQGGRIGRGDHDPLLLLGSVGAGDDFQRPPVLARAIAECAGYLDPLARSLRALPPSRLRGLLE